MSTLILATILPQKQIINATFVTYKKPVSKLEKPVVKWKRNKVEVRPRREESRSVNLLQHDALTLPSSHTSMLSFKKKNANPRNPSSPQFCYPSLIFFQ